MTDKLTIVARSGPPVAVTNCAPRIRVVDTLPMQIRTSRISLKQFKPVRNKADGWGSIAVKPYGTGLWTSTWTPNRSFACDWMRFCMMEDFNVASWRYGHVYAVREGLRIVEIDSLEDLHAVLNVYGEADEIALRMLREGAIGSRQLRLYPNWEKMAMHFDAVHLTERGQWATRLTHPHSLYGWDSESTLWLRLNRNTLKFVKKIRFGVGGRRVSRQERREQRQISRSRMRDALAELKSAEERRQREHDRRCN